MGQSTDGYEKAREEIQRGMQEQRGLEAGAERGFDPYSAAGRGGLGAYQQALGLGADPLEFYNQLLKGYRESPELKAQLEEGEKAGERAAAASGMLGSGAAIKHAAEQAQALRSQDVQNYLTKILGLRQQYLSGEAGLAGMGLRSAEDIMRGRAGLGQEIGAGYGGLARSYIGEAQQPSLGGQLLGIGGTLLGSYLGGPGGAELKNYLFRNRR